MVRVGDCKAKVIDGLEAAAKPAAGFLLVVVNSWGSVQKDKCWISFQIFDHVRTMFSNVYTITIPQATNLPCGLVFPPTGRRKQNGPTLLDTIISGGILDEECCIDSLFCCCISCISLSFLSFSSIQDS